ncbi:hypothetical protein DM860_013118 [Cuscuta australis]|uniref:Uncharacterized protein n=1 Tax=Cuscuta australis TaxID=267555 RepID=A0A328D827_9ASTE|nr:hypothetical protein DM860_013118 [Cuscuta australis]
MASGTRCASSTLTFPSTPPSSMKTSQLSQLKSETSLEKRRLRTRVDALQDNVARARDVFKNVIEGTNN